jgi:hypothetical protein
VVVVIVVEDETAGVAWPKATPQTAKPISSGKVRLSMAILLQLVR